MAGSGWYWVTLRSHGGFTPVMMCLTEKQLKDWGAFARTTKQKHETSEDPWVQVLHVSKCCEHGLEKRSTCRKCERSGAMTDEKTEWTPEERAFYEAEEAPASGSLRWLEGLDGSVRRELYFGAVIVRAFQAGQKYAAGKESGALKRYRKAITGALVALHGEPGGSTHLIDCATKAVEILKGALKS